MHLTQESSSTKIRPAGWHNHRRQGQHEGNRQILSAGQRSHCRRILCYLLSLMIKEMLGTGVGGTWQGEETTYERLCRAKGAAGPILASASELWFVGLRRLGAASSTKVHDCLWNWHMTQLEASGSMTQRLFRRRHCWGISLVLLRGRKARWEGWKSPHRKACLGARLGWKCLESLIATCRPDWRSWSLDEERLGGDRLERQATWPRTLFLTGQSTAGPFYWQQETQHYQSRGGCF